MSTQSNVKQARVLLYRLWFHADHVARDLQTIRSLASRGVEDVTTNAISEMDCLKQKLATIRELLDEAGPGSETARRELAGELAWASRPLAHGGDPEHGGGILEQ
jgi:hypothetical protein